MAQAFVKSYEHSYHKSMKMKPVKVSVGNILKSDSELAGYPPCIVKTDQRLAIKLMMLLEYQKYRFWLILKNQQIYKDADSTNV